MERVRGKGMEVVNVDSVVVAEKPRLSSHVERMKETLGSLLGVGKERVGIKAKTNEGIGLIGQQEAIASWAVVLLREK